MSPKIALYVCAGSAALTAVQTTQLLRLHRRMYDEVHVVAEGINTLRRDLPAVVAAYVDGFRGGQYAADLDEGRRHEDRRRGDRRGRTARHRAEDRWNGETNGGTGTT